MRMIFGAALTATALVGCSAQDSVALEHRSELSVQARGVELDERGEMSNVGMYGTTCEVSVDFAMIGDDFDYDSDGDMVVDLVTRPDAGITAVVITPDQVNITTPDMFPWTNTIDVIGVVDARVTDEGFVSVQVPPAATGSHCDLTWYDESGNAITTATASGVECDDDSDITTDAATGTTWVSTDAGVVRITADGAVLSVDSTPNARLSWDSDAQALYVGALGDTRVSAFEMDGAERWNVELDGSITALSHMGEDASAAVSITTPAGGELVVVDGASGEIRADLPTPSAAQDLDVSANGRVMAVTLPSSVHYFDVLALD